MSGPSQRQVGFSLGPTCPSTLAVNSAAAQQLPPQPAGQWLLSNPAGHLWQARALPVVLPISQQQHSTTGSRHARILPMASILGALGGLFSKPAPAVSVISAEVGEADTNTEAGVAATATAPSSATSTGGSRSNRWGKSQHPKGGDSRHEAFADLGVGKHKGGHGDGSSSGRQRHNLSVSGDSASHSSAAALPGLPGGSQRGSGGGKKRRGQRPATSEPGSGVAEGEVEGVPPQGGEQEEEEDTSETTEPFDVLRNIDRRGFRLFCSGCHKSTHRNDTTVAECNGCHRWFHPKCHQQHHIGQPAPNEEQTAGTSPEPWYHTAQCRKVLQSLVQRTARGLHPIPASTSTKPSVAQDGSGYGQEERSWRLVYCQRPGVLGQAALGQVHSVLSADWAYTMQDIRSFDFAALLKLPGTPACAALLDVYGPDVAELFVVSTAPRLRGRGLARDLVLRGIAPALAEAGVRRLAVSVDEGDEAGSALWAGYGFTPLKATELRHLGWQLPNFSKEATEGTNYYALDLTKVKP